MPFGNACQEITGAQPLVEPMLDLNKKKHSGKLAPCELDRLEREIASTDHQIDELVYEPYDITDAERKTIEE